MAMELLFAYLPIIALFITFGDRPVHSGLEQSTVHKHLKLMVYKNEITKWIIL